MILAALYIRVVAPPLAVPDSYRRLPYPVPSSPSRLPPVSHRFRKLSSGFITKEWPVDPKCGVPDTLPVQFFCGAFWSPGPVASGVSAGVPDGAILCSRIRVENHWESIGETAGGVVMKQPHDGGEGHAIFGIARRAESPAADGTQNGPGTQTQARPGGRRRRTGSVFDVSVKTQTSFCGLPFPLTPLTARWRDDEWPPLRSPAACRTARAAADGPEGLRQPRPSGVGDGRPGQTADPHLPCPA